MMNIIKKYLLGFVLALWASALSAQSHWDFDYTQFQYLMTVYYTINNDKVAVEDLSNYEVAAFVDDECRGIGTVISQGGHTVGQIIVRSNQLSGEAINLKCYDKSSVEEKELYGSAISFSSDGLVGMPSSPYVLDLVKQYTPGDADGDGVVDLTDAVAIFSYYMEGDYPNFNIDAADFDGDGVVDLTDAVLIFDYYMNQ